MEILPALNALAYYNTKNKDRKSFTECVLEFSFLILNHLETIFLCSCQPAENLIKLFSLSDTDGQRN
jgi:hypothetical protein